MEPQKVESQNFLVLSFYYHSIIMTINHKILTQTPRICGPRWRFSDCRPVRLQQFHWFVLCTNKPIILLHTNKHKQWTCIAVWRRKKWKQQWSMRYWRIASTNQSTALLSQICWLDYINPLKENTVLLLKEELKEKLSRIISSSCCMLEETEIRFLFILSFLSMLYTEIQ